MDKDEKLARNSQIGGGALDLKSGPYTFSLPLWVICPPFNNSSQMMPGALASGSLLSFQTNTLKYATVSDGTYDQTNNGLSDCFLRYDECRLYDSAQRALLEQMSDPSGSGLVYSFSDVQAQRYSTSSGDSNLVIDIASSNANVTGAFAVVRPDANIQGTGATDVSLFYNNLSEVYWLVGHKQLPAYGQIGSFNELYDFSLEVLSGKKPKPTVTSSAFNSDTSSCAYAMSFLTHPDILDSGTQLSNASQAKLVCKQTGVQHVITVFTRFIKLISVLGSGNVIISG